MEGFMENIIQIKINSVEDLSKFGKYIKKDQLWKRLIYQKLHEI